MAVRFTTTRLTGLRAAGRIVELQHDVIASFLQRELGPRHGRLFADFEPEGSDLRAWYSDVESPPRRVADLPPERRAALLATTAGLVEDIRALAGRMTGESAQKANLARALVAATTFPEEDVWADGDQPIVVNWGFAREDKPEALPRAITGLAAIPELPPQPLEARSATSMVFGRSWGARVGDVPMHGTGALAPLLWLLFAVLVAALYRLLLPACGIGDPWRPFAGWATLDACGAPVEAAQAAEEGTRLQALVRQAELQLAQQRQICTAPVPGRRASIDVEQRLPPTAPRGDVEISLLWDDRADLDLIVDCPEGQRLWQASGALQACGGRLLADVNKAGGVLLDHPIEHAAWDRPPPGVYSVKIQLYNYNDVAPGTDIPFTVHVRRGADETLVPGHVSGVGTITTATTVTF